MTPTKRIELAENNLQRINGWIANSDAKIGIALTFQAILPAFLATKGSDIKAIITNQGFDLIHFLLYLALVLFVFFTAKSMYHSFKALFPDITTRESSLFFFGSIANQGIQRFKREFSALTDTEAEDQINSQVFINSQIAVAKFGNVKASITSTLYAAFLWLTILALLSWLI